MKDPLRVSRYQHIFTLLKDRIVSGVYPCRSYLPSERELCEEFGVHRITVRKSLELLVNMGLAEKHAGKGTLVLDRGRSLYSPPQNSGHRYVVFVLCATDQGDDRFAEPFQSGLFYYLERRCADVGYHLIYKTATAGDHIADIIGGIDVSCLVFSSHFFGHYLTEAEELGIPLLFANHRHPEYTSVESDDLNASRKLIDYFIEQGHRRIAVIAGPQDYCTSRDRFAGWEAALRNRSIPRGEMPVFEGDWSFGSGYEAGKKIFALPKPDCPDGIFAFNDEMALGAIRALQEEGVSIPREISVAGYDDIAACTKIIPALTTVHVDIAAMAAAIVQQLYFNLREGGRAPVIQIRVPTWPVIRDSVADRRGFRPGEVCVAKEKTR